MATHSGVYRSIDTQNTGVNIKASAGQVYGWHITNNAASTRYVKLYDKATAPSSSDTPLLTLAIPAGQISRLFFDKEGPAFGTGLGIRGVTGVADNDNTAPTANDIVTNLFFF